MRASLVAQLVKNLPAMQETHGSIPGLGRFPWRRDRLPTPVFLGFPGEKNPPAMQETGFNSWVGKIPGGGHGNLLQYSCLENPHGQRSLVG